MLIDWFTVGAQIVNFLVLVWLLKRYLYRPILTAIDAREKDIVSRRDAAVAEQKKAQKEREECHQQKAALEQQRLALISAAREDAKTEGIRLLQEATHEAEYLRVARHKDLEKETSDYRDELVRLARNEIVATVRKILLDLSSAQLESSAVDAFLRRIEERPSLGKATIPRADGSPAAFRLRSAFALSPPQQEAAEKEIQKTFETRERVGFEVAPEIGLGLELMAGDEKMDWNIDNYLASLETSLTEFAKKKNEGVAK
jgi:F-type H+-transporting ATPase subunit b